MRADKLLSAITEASDLPHTDITAITEDSRKADAGSIFVCIKGARVDGHSLAMNAYQAGCRTFAAEQPLSLPTDAFVAVVPSTRAALATLANVFYDHPSHRLHVIGITGTKGKTTTACLISHILNDNGISCGYIGTNGTFYGDTVIPATNTTPDAVTLQKTLFDMAERGIQAVALEVSSQALMQYRVGGMRFGTVLFTNFSPDHVGEFEHPTLEHYRDTKHTLFTDFEAENAVWNLDDATTPLMQQNSRAPHNITFSTAQASDLYAANARASWKGAPGISFDLLANGEALPASLPLLGLCNISNALAALTVTTRVFGLPAQNAVASLAGAHVPGRSECISLPNGAAAVIDYAHNGESLKQILTSLREYRPKRLIALFGSVGDRSQMRRAELGRVAAAMCDLAILTSDNPGNEDPEKIISEIASHFAGTDTPYITVSDREEAIRHAISITKAGDILLLAGKGHEDYQLIGREKRPFSERAIVMAAAQELQPII